jgi:hypothetical protein
MAKADQRPSQAASARATDAAEDTRDTADFESASEVVDAVAGPESDANKPTSLLDKEVRMRAELAAKDGPQEDAPRATVWGDAVDGRGNVLSPYAVEDNDTSAYVGVNPEYATYANETERPFRAEEGTAERYFEDQLTSPKKFAVGAGVQSQPTEGGGSSVPLLYPDVSGEGYVNEGVKVTEVPVGVEVLSDEQRQAREAAVQEQNESTNAQVSSATEPSVSNTTTRDGATPSEKF